LDILRPKRVRRIKPVYLVAVGLGLLLTTTVWLSRLKAASPEVERATLLVDTVKRGSMLRQVHANGTLVPEDQRTVSALTAGRIDRVLVRPGARIAAGATLVELSNPDVQLEALDAERQLKLAEAELASLRVNLETARLAQESALATARTELNEARRSVAVAERLAKEGLGSSMDADRAKDRQTEAEERFASETRRKELADEALGAQVDLRRADVERLRAISRFQQERVGSMRVRALEAGVVQELNLEPGQWVQSGQRLARVTSSDRLKAVLLVPESQARDVSLGQVVSVDTRNGVARGHVSRIDPAVQNGTVSVDAALEGALPRGARPDLSVDGTIEIERLANVLSVGLPAEGSSESTARLYRLEADGRTAVRVPVQLGRASFNAVEVLSGLREGDRVILSEMSRWSNVDRVRLR
jgi:multidrug efflux pump subunit AcrA (membrane-fusion protein)